MISLLNILDWIMLEICGGGGGGGRVNLALYKDD